MVQIDQMMIMLIIVIVIMMDAANADKDDEETSEEGQYKNTLRKALFNLLNWIYYFDLVNETHRLNTLLTQFIKTTKINELQKILKTKMQKKLLIHLCYNLYHLINEKLTMY